MRLHVSPNIFYEELQGFLVILNLRTEAYYILDPVGTSMWKALLATGDEAEALPALENRYSVERARLKTDLASFRHRCIEQGFLQEKEVEQRAEIPLSDRQQTKESQLHTQPKFPILRAWWSLFRTVRSLSVHGFSRTYLEYSRLPIPKDKSREVKNKSQEVDDLLKRLVTAFTRAENFFLIKSAPKDCVARSLALFRFLRLSGLPVEHCIGVRRFPFQAHAWVEYHGRVVQDNPSRQLTFRTLVRIQACEDL